MLPETLLRGEPKGLGPDIVASLPKVVLRIFDRGAWNLVSLGGLCLILLIVENGSLGRGLCSGPAKAFIVGGPLSAMTGIRVPLAIIEASASDSRLPRLCDLLCFFLDGEVSGELIIKSDVLTP